MCINSTFLPTIITVSVLALCLAHSVVYTECSCSFYFVELQLNNFVQNIFANGSIFFLFTGPNLTLSISLTSLNSLLLLD